MNAANEIIVPISVIASLTITSIGFFINYMVRVNKKVDSKVSKDDFEDYKVQTEKDYNRDNQNLINLIDTKANKVAYIKDIENINKKLAIQDEMQMTLKRIEISLAENKSEIKHVKETLTQICKKVDKIILP